MRELLCVLAAFGVGLVGLIALMLAVGWVVSLLIVR